MSTKCPTHLFETKMTHFPNKALAAGAILLVLMTGCQETIQTITQIPPTFTIAHPKVEPTQLPNTPTEPAISASSTPFPAGNQIQIEIWTRPSDAMVILHIPTGSFPMGSTQSEIEDAINLCKQHYSTCNRWYYEQESPQHLVSLNAFWLDQTEVTNQQYRKCVEDGVCSEPNACKKGEPTYTDPGKIDHPTVCVSWDEAQAYCEWAGGRLPTEAEWEYAFRGEKGLIYPWGNTFDGTKLNYCDVNCAASHADERYDDGYSQTSPAYSYLESASWSGAVGMAGNVSEWVADWLGNYSAEALTDPSGPASGSQKVVKGCSWFFHPTYCRGAARASAAPGTRYDYLGFRCVASSVE
jgi:formylglycine-generating enzyme required for sulfatase activity